LGKADGALAASVFHFGEIKIRELKSFLYGNGVAIRTLNPTI
jgi:imidazole glycerol-phosphate synthase subunit HisF